MRNLTRALGAVALLLLAPALAFSANGDTLNIGGSVPLVLTLVVTPDANADNLVLHAPAATPTVTIATIDVSTNNTAGWELWVFSTTGEALGSSTLRSADDEDIAYTVTYPGGATGAAIIAGGLMLKEDPLNGSEAASALQITYAQAEDHDAGYYSDQLTLVLRAK